MNAPLAFPYAIGPGGRSARADHATHLRELLEQIVFTEPGERVNRPDFGCSLRHLVFADGASELTTAIEALAQAALRQWANPAIQIQGVDVRTDDGMVAVTVRYLELASGQLRQVRVEGA